MGVSVAQVETGLQGMPSGDQQHESLCVFTCHALFSVHVWWYVCLCCAGGYKK